ncbi:MAG: Lrp/AsnC family transcriptional regulator [Candidatus Brocadiia bacterium]|nr:MAG: Lrp/AsnC family transcriptional regulator [Candidatus Brocadiia bacterium]
MDRRVLAVLQKGFPNTRTPFEDMAQSLAMDTGQLLKLLRDWKNCGKLRRIGAIVSHFKLGIGSGAMVVWQVEPDRVEQAGLILAGFEQVSHAYERAVTDNWVYNLYTMVHGTSRLEVEESVQRMSKAAGVFRYRILFTERELKKVSPTYVIQDAN